MPCTYAIGGFLSGGWINAAGAAQILLIMDQNGNLAAVYSVNPGGGVTLLSTSVGFTGQVTYAPTVDDFIKSATVYSGGSSAAGPSIGGDVIFGDGFMGAGADLGIGPSLPPVGGEGHVLIGGHDGPFSTQVIAISRWNWNSWSDRQRENFITNVTSPNITSAP
jgi:hypothetical protein